jgi:chemotaxis protein methyltransferase CheR
MAEDASASAALRRGVELVASVTGVQLPAYRWPLLQAALERIGRARSAADPVELLSSGDPEVTSQIIRAVTVPETFMFRYPGQLEILRDLAARRSRHGKGCSVLCAGCSTGEEVWSVAATLADLTAPPSARHRVVGWDLCEDRLHQAERGRYSSWAFRAGLNGHERFFHRRNGVVTVDPALRQLVSFRQVNLVGATVPQAGRFDAIFFNNVAIYWAPPHIAAACDRLSSLTADDGVILVGPSDPVRFDPEQWEQRIANHARSFWRTRSRPAKPVARHAPGTGGADIRPAAPGDAARSPTTRPGRTSPPAVCGPAPKAQTESLDQPAEEADAVLAQVRILADRGHHQEALDLLGRYPVSTTPDGRLWQGILLLALDSGQRAVQVLRQCVFLRPEGAEYRQWLAVAYRSIGREADADREMRNARELGAP